MDAQEQLSGFGQAGLTTVLLPSGYRVRGVIPGLAALAQAGRIDRRVLVAVARLGTQRWWTEPAETSEAQEDEAVDDWLDAAIAGYCREAIDPPGDLLGEWKLVRLTAADVRTMDQRDRLWLAFLVLRLRTAEEVTAAIEAGLVDPEEAPGEIDRLAGFRDDRRGPVAGTDGESVVDAPIGAAEG